MIHHTENETTSMCGQAIATVIADSVSPYDGTRITTFELVYPRYIHSELMTHRVFSRNASSSRATPLKVTLDEVVNDPVFFDFVGKNQAGMVAGEELEGEELACFKDDWELLGAQVARRVEQMSEKYGIHKQTLNRALEPWLRIRTLVTSTEWENFFKLRIAEDAQPEMRSLALAMKRAGAASNPVEDHFHTPYVSREPKVLSQNEKNQCIARCARVSYARHDGKEPSLEDDLKLYERLKVSGHMSPFEHCAFAEEGQWANFKGWRSVRNYLEESK